MQAPEVVAPTFTELDFIAQLLYDAACIKQGYAASTRWWCTDAAIRFEWYERARYEYQQWAQAEQSQLFRSGT